MNVMNLLQRLYRNFKTLRLRDRIGLLLQDAFSKYTDSSQVNERTIFQQRFIKYGYLNTYFINTKLLQNVWLKSTHLWLIWRRGDKWRSHQFGLNIYFCFSDFLRSRVPGIQNQNDSRCLKKVLWTICREWELTSQSTMYTLLALECCTKRKSMRSLLILPRTNKR